MFGWFTGNKNKQVVVEETVPEVAMEGHDVHVNLPLNSKLKIRRHLVRILRCMDALDEAPANAIEYIEEIKTRRAQLVLQGVEAPETRHDIDALIRSL